MNPAPGRELTAAMTTPFPACDYAVRPGLGRTSGRVVGQAELGQLVRAVGGAPETWRSIVQFTSHSRWFRRLALTDDYEVWLLTWLPGQRTGFHDHGDARGAFTVAEGELRESLASAGSRRIRHRRASQGSVTRFGGQHLHDVSNASAAPAVSVHAYSPPLSAMRRYEMTDSGLALVRTERAEIDW